MASSESPVKIIDEQFCQCPICLQQYNEPKLLPCLHRYCSDCLKKIIEKNQGVTVLKCPECRDEFSVPNNGVDGLKTDFYIKNIIEYIQLQISLEDNNERECCDCSKKLNVKGFCFKCNDVLCKSCYGHHLTKKILKDHVQHTISVEDLKSKNLTLENLISLKEAPRCRLHPQNLSQLCCKDCSNIPICVTCTYGSHKSHSISDVGTLATQERFKLKRDLQGLIQYKVWFSLTSGSAEARKQQHISDLNSEKSSYQEKHKSQIKSIQQEMKQMKENYHKSKNEIEMRREQDVRQQREKMKKEIQKIKTQYGNICNEIRKKAEHELKELHQTLDEQMEHKCKHISILEGQLTSFMTLYKSKMEEGLKNFEEMKEQCKGILKRCENLSTTADSILGSKNDWTAVHCIPDVCLAIERLNNEVERKFPESRHFRGISIAESENSPVDIEGMNNTAWTVYSITSNDDGSIVVTGDAPKDCRHITVIDTRGNVLRQEKFVGSRYYYFGVFASKFKVATVYSNKIGLHDIRDSSYIEKNIKDIISDWPADRHVKCVATDLVNNHIFVGVYGSREIYVFDHQLKYHHRFTLPWLMKYRHDMAVICGNLIVCDSTYCNVSVISMEGVEGTLLQKLPSPDIERDKDDYTSPISVCGDKNGFIYVLWMSGMAFAPGKRFLSQYSQDGSKILSTRPVTKNARCITTVVADDQEKLLLVTQESGRLFVFNIM
ncbi:E3 ubiquitin-protein ligase TRIM56 [Holothuria leucospilota]|uniref:E3 ubiquitin-protein ligase TRIM56 n=1 Tax=Holothuria leucospilota TaxID=206669 RepID=A0A9Q1H3R3_HOLLE|nr:E3 ubiquitin-protein ligase TRIM56 [Holothuria leucospilota]